MVVTKLEGLQVIVGAGNLGRCVYNALKARGLKVRCVDINLPNEKMIKLFDLQGEEMDFRQHRIGIDPISKLKEHFEGAEVVYSMVSPDLTSAPAHLFYQVNFAGIRDIITACELAGVLRLVHVSSVAATNHFVVSDNWDESYPSPPLETYCSPYDITKRLGEEAVLNSKSSKLAVCAIRPAGIVLSPTDYCSRGAFGTEMISNVIGEEIDICSGHDIAVALIKAAEVLKCNPENERVNGSFLYVTKFKIKPENTNKRIDVQGTICKKMNKEVKEIPNFFLPLIIFILYIQHCFSYIFNLLTNKPQPGIPLFVLTNILRYKKTFDNSKAEKELNYKPQYTLDDAVNRVIKDWEIMNS